MRYRVFVPATILIVALVAIVLWRGSSKPEAGTMLKAWHESVQNLGVRAIYPLQESLYPGNMLLVPTYPGKAKWFEEKPAEYYTNYLVRIGSLDLCQLYLSLKNAPEIPPVTNFEPSGGTSAGSKPFTPWQPTEIRYSHFKCNDYRGPDFRVNRVMAFPAFQFGSLAESGVSANVLNGVTGLLGSLVGNNEYRMTVSIPSATVIRVDLHDLLTALNNYSYSTTGGVSDVQVILGRMKNVQTVRDKQGVASPPELLVVTEVYYANAIDISIASSAARASDLSISTQALAQQFDQLKKLREQLQAARAEADASTGDNANTSDSAPQREAMKELAKQIAEKEAEVDRLSKVILPGAPGVTGAVKSVSSSGVTLTQVFPRPMAFGYRAIGFDPDQYSRMH
ncbi:hypothetical protein N8H72_20835 [Pseudomonas koreensis]|uniref:hypothetical protein n=1 Tax=Pseudomonas koreensis TaxID=198620 RepID=UPI0021C67721|nr:hypothetical protein [Pseudomonas koreensis]MCU0092432.1 hypothetical protein [Pseudomonas koreensis]